MPIFKIFKEDKYSQISNDLINDPSLSLRAKGLLCFLISKPVTWNMNVNHLNTVCKEGKDAIYATINELIDAGYIVRFRIKNEHGKFFKCDYHVYEKPQRAFPDAVKPDTDNPDTEKPDNSNTEPINKESSKGADAPPVSPEEEVRKRKIAFLKLVIDWVIDNPGKYPKKMCVDFAKYWVEPSIHKKKMKLRFEDQQFFDVGRRLSTWFQKVDQTTLHEYWEQEQKIETLNQLFKTQILQLNAAK